MKTDCTLATIGIARKPNGELKAPSINLPEKVVSRVLYTTVSDPSGVLRLTVFEPESSAAVLLSTPDVEGLIETLKQHLNKVGHQRNRDEKQT